MTKVLPRRSLGVERLQSLATAAPFEVKPSLFYFLRHGETDGNLTRVFQAPDQPLNETGLAQAGRAAEVLEGQPIKRIVASDWLRAATTADIVSRRLTLSVEKSEGLQERFFGDWIGTSSAVLDWSKEPPGGEWLGDFVQRCRKGIAQALNAEQTTLIVSHGGPLLVLLAALKVEPPEMGLGNAAPLKFEKQANGWTVTPLAESRDAPIA